MNNATLTQSFLDMYRLEILDLAAAISPSTVNVSFDGKLPEGLVEKSGRKWQYRLYDVDSEGAEKMYSDEGTCVKISFSWKHIISKPYQLRNGLIVLAQCLYVVSQQIAQPYVNVAHSWQCDGCAVLPDRAVQRLYSLFPVKEMTAKMAYGCLCNRCMSEALARLRQTPRFVIPA